MQLLKQGAEATLCKSTYLSEKCVVKTRQRKRYREPELDKKIVEERLRTECNLVSRAKKAGVRTPLIFGINKKELSITFEYIAGNTLKEELEKVKSHNAAILCAKLGLEIAKLHSAGIVHSDLTTSNAVLHNGKIVILDLGMGMVSNKTEDMAVDLLALKRTFLATHFRHAKQWKNACLAYSRNFGRGASILKHVKKVEARARYY